MSFSARLRTQVAAGLGRDDGGSGGGSGGEMLMNVSEHVSGKINIQSSREFVTNNRGQRLHVRSYWPHTCTNAPNLLSSPRKNGVKGVIVSLHGYCAHISRPVHGLLGDYFTSRGYAYVTLDFHGHGHSMGQRALINNPLDLVDDALALLFALFGLTASTSTDRASEQEYHLSHTILESEAPWDVYVPLEQRKCLRKDATPLILMGQSMGGGTVLLTAHLLRHALSSQFLTPYCLEDTIGMGKRLDQLSVRLQGAILFSPLISLPPVAAAAAWIFTPLALLCPSSSLPLCLIDENDEQSLGTVWSCSQYREYIRHDQAASLTFGGNTRFRTLSSLKSLTTLVDLLPKMHDGVDVPLLILFDPQDASVSFSGAQQFLQQCGPSAKHSVKPISGGGHDLLVNDLDVCIQLVTPWLDGCCNRPLHTSQ